MRCAHLTLAVDAFAHLRLPSFVLACKSDLDKQVNPSEALTALKRLSVSIHYDVGLVETTASNAEGKDKIRTAFEWLFHTLLHPDGEYTDDLRSQHRCLSVFLMQRC